MAFATFIGSAIFIAVTVSLPTSKRKQEFELIQNYELVFFDTDLLASNIMQLNAFNSSFTIHLFKKEDMIPSSIRHSSIQPSEHSDDQYYTSLNTSCHFGGYFTDDHANDYYRVSVSMCPKRGIRARFTVGTETIVIKPAEYYLSMQVHDSYELSDQHLVFRTSDLDTSLQDKFSRVHTSLENLFKKKQINNEFAPSEVSERGTQRRRLFNNGYQRVEVLVVTGPVMARNYKNDGGNWYERMVSEYNEIINDASSAYENMDWPSEIGDVELRMVDLEVAEEYTGRYASLAPQFNSAGCTVFDSSCSPNSLLDPMGEWLVNVKGDFDKWDTAHGFFDINMNNIAGRAYRPGICVGSSGGASGWSTLCCGEDYFVSTVAHEIGHNLNLLDEYFQQAGNCYKSGKVMDGGLISTGFSSCNRNEMLAMFQASWPPTTCLADSFNTFTGGSGGSGPLPTPQPTVATAPTPRPTVVTGGDDGNACVKISRFEGFDGEWRQYGTWDGVPAYTNGNGMYLYRTYGYWTITDTLGAWGDINGWRYGWCQIWYLGDVQQCDNYWAYDDNAIFESCWAFEAGLPDCLLNNPAGSVDESLCFDDNVTNHRFKVDLEEECMNDVAYYSGEDNAEYSLYFDALGHWRLDMEAISYLCFEKLLLNCTHGSWIRQMDDGDEVLRDLQLDVTIAKCETQTDLYERNPKLLVSTKMVAVASIVVLFMLVTCVGFCCFCCKKKQRKQVSFKNIKKEQEVSALATDAHQVVVDEEPEVVLTAEIYSPSR